MNPIQQFKEISDYVTAMNLNVENRFSDFLIYDYNTQPPEACSTLHSFRQNYFEVSLEISNGCNTIVDQFELPPIENRLTLISPHRLQKFGEQQSGNSFHKGFGILFKPEFINTDSHNPRFLKDFPFFSHLNAPFISLANNEVELFQGILNKIQDEYKLNSNSSREIIKNYLNILILKANENYSQNAVSSKNSGRNREIFEKFSMLIQHHYLEWRTVREYADRLYITPKHLSETVKNVSGQTALSHIHEAQVNHAKALLLQTPKTISEIAYDLNFENPEYFSVFFKRLSGKSPSQYRVSGI